MEKLKPKIAIVPLRAGSKGIPNKNRKKVLGRPLFTWVLAEAIQSNLDHIYVFTDDNFIKSYIQKEYTWTDKVSVVERSAESASDTASTEDAMFELAQKLNFNFSEYYLLQATSPLTTACDINTAMTELSREDTDSVISVVRTHRFIWDGNGKSINYNYMTRPRRQDFNGLLIENGAIYGCTCESYKLTKNRLGGNIKEVEMPEDSLVEIDEPADMLMIEHLLQNRLKQFKKPVVPIKYIILDVDGVFTNATVAYNKEGEFSKTFNIQDGMGLEILRENGVQPIIMTSEDSVVVKQRMSKLNIEHVYLGIKDKFAFIMQLLKELNVSRNELAYLGDDINDWANIASVGWGICPSNVTSDIARVADLKLHASGGDGAIRELIEFILKYNSRL
jgi:N-acylneuraminate cytidylyltransferase